MAGYTMHAGHALEVAPRGQQANYRGNPEWCASPADSRSAPSVNRAPPRRRFDFGACAVPTDHEGYCEVRTVGLRHVAVRTCGRESKFQPAVRSTPGGRSSRQRRRAACRQALMLAAAQVKNIAPRPKDWQPAPAK